jgi:ABC-type glycerol-3-phosphate transport system substrate-binding protein
MLRFAICFVAGVLTVATSLFAPQADWKKDWEETLAAAKKEGRLVLYGSADYEQLFAEFQKKYPEIKVTGIYGRGADVAKRMLAERRAEKFLADVYVNGQGTGYNVLYKASAVVDRAEWMDMTSIRAFTKDVLEQRRK